jgi:hypothetical protein
MTKLFDRDVFFGAVRGSLFHGSMTQRQVDGMNAILDAWEENPRSDDLRWLAYPLATTAHETGFAMWPIEEYGRGEGMSYGQQDPETGQTYYGRGFVQLTWRENYARADKELAYGTTARGLGQSRMERRQRPEARRRRRGHVPGHGRGLVPRPTIAAGITSSAISTMRSTIPTRPARSSTATKARCRPGQAGYQSAT